jgi:peptide-methionine (R)-S-oxide reductase
LNTIVHAQEEVRSVEERARAFPSHPRWKIDDVCSDSSSSLDLSTVAAAAAAEQQSMRIKIDTSCITLHSATCFRVYLSMRIPSLPNFVRTFYAFSNATFNRAAPAPFSLSAARPAIALRSYMPAIPFIGSFFHTAETRNMSHPVQKSDEEWRMQLNKGTSQQVHTSLFFIPGRPKLTSIQRAIPCPP